MACIGLKFEILVFKPENADDSLLPNDLNGVDKCFRPLLNVSLILLPSDFNEKDLDNDLPSTPILFVTVFIPAETDFLNSLTTASWLFMLCN
jgi:hypothetical protein